MSRFHEQYYNIQVTTATQSIKFQLVLFWMTSCCETLYWGSSAHWCTRGRVLLVSCVTSMLSQMFNGFNSVRCAALMGVVVSLPRNTLQGTLFYHGMHHDWLQHSVLLLLPATHEASKEEWDLKAFVSKDTMLRYWTELKMIIVWHHQYSGQKF